MHREIVRLIAVETHHVTDPERANLLLQPRPKRAFADDAALERHASTAEPLASLRQDQVALLLNQATDRQNSQRLGRRPVRSRLNRIAVDAEMNDADTRRVDAEIRVFDVAAVEP